MNPLTMYDDVAKLQKATLEECLNFLCMYGHPRISKQDNGWYCSVKVFVTIKGVSFEAVSDFDHGTPAIAGQVCISRLVQAIRELNKEK